MAELRILMTIPSLLEAVQGICLCNYSPLNGFSSVATDSRNVQSGSMFVPLIGEYQDGHQYIHKALESGASVILVDEEHASGSSSVFSGLAKQYNACVIQVPKTLRALQDAARWYVKQFPSLLKIGVTGSSGKTTTKEILGAIFSQKYAVVMNEGNLNSETGLPLSVFKIRSEHQIGIFELGMNRRNEISEIARVLSPVYALITNIGTAHIGILGTQHAIAEEKKAVFSFFSSDCKGFVPEDDSFAEFLKEIPAGTVYSFGVQSTPGFEQAEDRGIDGTRIRYEGVDIHFPLPGYYNFKNALGAISVAREAGCSPLEIKNGLESVKPLFGRAEIKKGSITVMLDCYNANPDSMERAIEFCSSVAWKRNKIFVLGSMLELGAESETAHRSVCAKAAVSGVRSVLFFGSEIIEAARNTEWGAVKVYFLETIEEVIATLKEAVSEGDLVLVKGSRGMALERIMPALSERFQC